MKPKIQDFCVIAALMTGALLVSTPATAGEADGHEGSHIAAIDIDAPSDVGPSSDESGAASQSMSRADLRGSIQVVILSGVQLFNQGNAAATKRIYTDAARRLLASPVLSTNERRRLQRDLRSSLRASSARESAWQLRHALDDVVDSLDEAGTLREETRSLHG